MPRKKPSELRCPTPNNPLLLIPAKADPERDAVAECWLRDRGEVLRLDRFWEPPELDRCRVRLYGPDTFCLVLAQKLDLQLVSPADDLLLNAPIDLLGRNIRVLTLETIVRESFPLFAKSLIPKLFRSRVYGSSQALLDECQGLEPATPILVSEPVQIRAEARAFVLAQQVKTCAVYEGLAEAPWAFVGQAAGRLKLPVSCVLDAALLPEGWALLEANASWGAGLNGCDPAAVLDCIDLATQNPEALAGGA